MPRAARRRLSTTRKSINGQQISTKCFINPTALCLILLSFKKHSRENNTSVIRRLGQHLYVFTVEGLRQFTFNEKIYMASRLSYRPARTEAIP